MGATENSAMRVVAVGTAIHPGGLSAAVNMFSNPIAVFDNARPLILGLDSRSGGAGRISGLPYLNLDASVKKSLAVRERYSLELSGVFENVMNHLDFANPSLSLQSASSLGRHEDTGQYATPDPGRHSRQLLIIHACE
jgi:hypothetical protein